MDAKDYRQLLASLVWTNGEPGQFYVAGFQRTKKEETILEGIWRMEVMPERFAEVLCGNAFVNEMAVAVFRAAGLRAMPEDIDALELIKREEHRVKRTAAEWVEDPATGQHKYAEHKVKLIDYVVVTEGGQWISLLDYIQVEEPRFSFILANA